MQSENYFFYNITVPKIINLSYMLEKNNQINDKIFI